MSGTLPLGHDVAPPRVPSEPPDPPMHFPFDRPRSHTLSGMARGVLAAAAIWAGLAMIISAYAYLLPAALHVTLVIAGAWLFVAGAAFVFAMARPVAA